MNKLVDCDPAAMSVKIIKRQLQTFMTKYRPRSSDKGALRSGPAASPSSQMVTMSAAVDEDEAWPSRSETMRDATGTTPMQVKVLE